MATLYELPFTADAQQFTVALDDRRLRLNLAWRNLGGAGWVLDIDDEDGTPLVHGLPLTTGADMLAQHKHLGIPGEIWVATDSVGDVVPTYTNLGIAGRVYWIMP